MGVMRSARAPAPATLPAISATVTSATNFVVASIGCHFPNRAALAAPLSGPGYEYDDVAHRQSPCEDRLGLCRVLRRQCETGSILLLLRVWLRSSRVRRPRD